MHRLRSYAIVSGLAAATLVPSALGDVIWTDINTQNGSAGDRLQYARDTGIGERTIVTGGLVDPYGIDVDALNGRLYWTEVNGNRIQSSYLDGTDVQEVLQTGPLPSHLAVDAANGRLYWTENSGGGRIMSANLDGTDVTEIATGFSGILGLVIDAEAGVLYWSDRGTGAPAEIGRIDIDGTDRVVLLDSSDGLNDPAGLAIDATSIYWADTLAGAIGRADLDGSNVSTVVDGLNRPHGLALDGATDRLYWTDFADFNVMSVGIDGSDITTLASTDEREVRDLVVLPGMRQLAEKPGDPNGDGVVDFQDLLMVLAAFGS